MSDLTPKRIGRPPIHGMSRSSEYCTYKNMILRCYEPRTNRYESYGGAGITVCESWRRTGAAGFLAFFESMGLKPTPAHTIDRIKGALGYWCGKCSECVSLGREPNCRWATRAENNANRRRVGPVPTLFTVGDRALTLRQWSDECGVGVHVLFNRISRGVPLEQAMAVATRPRHRMVTIDGVTKPVGEWCRQLGVSKNTLFSRERSGFDVVTALTMAPLRVRKRKAA